MEQITDLNARYVERKGVKAAIERHLKEVNEIRNNSSVAMQERIAAVEKRLKEVRSKIDCREYAMIGDAISLGDKYLECISNIVRYKSIAMSIDSGDSSLLQDIIKKVTDSEGNYAREKESFCQKNGVAIDSSDALVKVMSQSLENAIGTEEATVEGLKEKVRKILKHEPSIEMKGTDALIPPAALPEGMVVGRQDSPLALEILKDMGIHESHRYIRTDLRRQGNVLIKTAFKYKEDENLNAFIIAYILRFIESFPVGAVQIHIFKQDKSNLYDALMNPFSFSEKGDTVQKTIQFHSDYYELQRFKNVICEEIAKKFYNTPASDLYSAYENNDKSEPFHLIVLGDGLTGGGRGSQSEILKTIRFLSKIREKGHKCGFRFLIVDTGSSSVSRSDEEIESLTSDIWKYCELKLNYGGGGRFEEISGDKAVETRVLYYREDPGQYIDERAKKIAKIIGDKEKGIVSYNDVFAPKTEENLDNILHIPIGMAGREVVEIPFSCKNSEKSAAGGCIGYMVLGMSGYGKSSLFNSLVMNGCMKYSPRDLQFWLLDFKDGVETTKFKDAGLPHIKVISEKNKKEDASVLFQMIKYEMERRYNIFPSKNTNNIADYNRIARAEGLEGFSRILIIIDEAQELFSGTGGSATALKELIKGITQKMRGAGLHFVMIAQNLDDNADMLRQAFINNVTGRICLRLEDKPLRESGFGEEYTDKRRTEILALNAGEAYVSYGANTIRKVGIAFAETLEMPEYYQLIRERYPEESYAGPLVIGASSRLAVTDNRQAANETFVEYMKSLSRDKAICRAVIGESVYGMNPVLLSFTQLANSSVLFLGSDKNIASSLCASTAASLLIQGTDLHLVNGDMQNGLDGMLHPFKFLCENFGSSSASVNIHMKNQFSGFLQELYLTYLDRKELDEKQHCDSSSFSPVVSIINDLTEIYSFLDNELIEIRRVLKDENRSEEEKKTVDTSPFSFGIPDLFEGNQNPAFGESHGEVQRKYSQDMLRELFESGYRYNMHFVIALKKYPDAWRSFYNLLDNKKSAVFFNDDNYTGKMTGAAELRERLANIRNQEGEETVALWNEAGTIEKIRPILYRMSDDGEKDALSSLINVGT